MVWAGINYVESIFGQGCRYFQQQQYRQSYHRQQQQHNKMSTVLSTPPPIKAEITEEAGVQTAGPDHQQQQQQRSRSNSNCKNKIYNNNESIISNINNNMITDLSTAVKQNDQRAR